MCAVFSRADLLLTAACRLCRLPRRDAEAERHGQALALLPLAMRGDSRGPWVSCGGGMSVSLKKRFENDCWVDDLRALTLSDWPRFRGDRPRPDAVSRQNRSHSLLIRPREQRSPWCPAAGPSPEPGVSRHLSGRDGHSAPVCCIASEAGVRRPDARHPEVRVNRKLIVCDPPKCRRLGHPGFGLPRNRAHV